MKRLITSATLVLTVFLATSGYADQLKPFIVTGELINIGMDLKVIERSKKDQTTEEKSGEGSQSPSVVITRMESNEDGTSMDVEVASSSFEDGRVELEANIGEPTKVLVSVHGIGDRPLTLKTMASPGESLSFVALDYASERIDDELLFVGTSRLYEESEAKFTISGDLSSITDKDLSVAIVEITSTSGKTLEGSIVATSNPIFLDDGAFLFEGIAHEPLAVFVSVHTPEFNYWGVVDVIVEPGARIKISPSTTSSSFHQNRASDLMANSETKGSMHAKVIESWQNNDKYLAKLDEYAATIKREQQKTSTETDDETDEAQEVTTDTPEESIPDSYDIFQEMESIKNSVLSPMITNMEDPMVALLAMEIGVPEARQLKMWDKLAEVLDADLIERRVQPRREARAKQIRLANNVEHIVEGQAAPDFTLANLEGGLVTLSDVLSKNEFVLVDFWDSRCGPCIASIPKLKELYTEYQDYGFEIVFVSIDEEYDDWKGESERQEIPWVNVGDLNGWLAQTAVDYGVQWIPTEFALDSKGKILGRNVSLEELENLLTDRFRDSDEKEETDEQSVGDDEKSP